MRRKRPTNVLQILDSRERNLFPWSRVKHLSYANYRLLKELILSKDAKFRVVKTIRSRGGGIFYEQRRLFQNGYTTSLPCHTNDGVISGSWYRDKRTAVKDGALFLMCPVNQILNDGEGKAHFRNSVIGLSKQRDRNGAHNLIFIDFHTGKDWHNVELPIGYLNNGSPRARFWQELDWNIDQESLFLRSTHGMPRFRTAVPEEDIPDQRHDADFVVAFLVLSVHPAEVIASFTISKSVFGSRIGLASINNDCLITLYSRDVIKIHSLLDLMIANPEMKSARKSFNKDSVIPKIISVPPVLFNIKSDDFYLELGGFPWHALVKLKKSSLNDCKFALVDIASGRTSGVIGSSDRLSLDPEVANFRDDSGIVVYVSQDRLQTFRIARDAPRNDGTRFDCSPFLEVKYTLTTSLCGGKTLSPPSDDGTTVTRSGRRVKKRQSLDPDNLRGEFVCTGYEDDLDLTFVVHLDHNLVNNEGKAQLWLVEDNVGKVLKKISLRTKWDDEEDVLENNVEMDLDLIIHSILKYNGETECVVYALDRTIY